MLVISFSKYFKLGIRKNDRVAGINLGFVSIYISKMSFIDYTEDVSMDFY
jgi:hypothetical protein